MKNLLKPLAKSGLIPLRLTVAASKQRGGFLSMLLGTFSSSLLGNRLAGNRVKAKIPGRGESKGTIKEGQDFLDMA